MTPVEVRDRVLERVGDRAAAEVVVTRESSALTRFANSFIHQNVAEDVTTVHLGLFADGRLARGASRVTTDDGVGALIERTLAAAAASPVDEHFPGFAPPAETPSLDHHHRSTADAAPADRAEIVRQFVDAGEGLVAAGYCETIEWQVAFGNSEGQMASAEFTRAVVDGIHQTDSSAGKGHQASKALADLDGEAAGRQAASKARASEDAFDLKPGRYEVVLEPNAVGTVALFLGYYGFNGLAVAEGHSFARLGADPFDPSLQLRNDGLHPEAIGAPFDADGTPVQRTELVEDGVIVGHVHDRSTAARLGVTSTGNALPGAGRRSGPIPLQLFVDPGDRSRDELIGSVERGLLVTEFNYCRVLDPLSMGFTGLTRNGTFMIENGAVTGAVTNLRFTQGLLEALAPGQIRGIESSARLADSEFGAGFTNVPSMHLATWNFTGGAGG